MRLSFIAVAVLAIWGTCITTRGWADEPSEAAVARWVKEQLDDGRLTVEFYDPNKQPKPFPGWTDFDFRLEYRYEFKVEFPKNAKKNAPTTATIVPKFTKVELPVKNKILLPKFLESDRWYTRPLAKHELEHVRAGLHPRLTMLAQHLVKKVQRLEHRVDKPSVVNADWASDRINEAMAPRRDALKALVANINRKIDDDTRHGGIPYPNFEDFLDRLYLKENLDDMKFPFLAEVNDLLATPDYQKAKSVIREPAADAAPSTK